MIELPPSCDRLVTLVISIDRSQNVYSEIQTHDNSFSEVATGLTAIKAEIERVFAERKKCPYYPSNSAEANQKIVRDNK